MKNTSLPTRSGVCWIRLMQAICLALPVMVQAQTIGVTLPPPSDTPPATPMTVPVASAAPLAAPPIPNTVNTLPPMRAEPNRSLRLSAAPERKMSTTTPARAASAAKAVAQPSAPGAPQPLLDGAADEAVTQHVLWNKVPIIVALRVGQERRVTLPARMRIAVPPDLSRKLALLLVDDTAYITATAAFDKIRLIAEDPVRGVVMLLDVSAHKTLGATGPLRIHLPGTAPTDDVAVNSPLAAVEAPDYVTLTRFAARQIYAPRRLATETPGVAAVTYQSRIVRGLYRGGNVVARAIGAWRSDQHYVTAVKLTNTDATALELDPREVRGAWLTVTFHHGRLLPQGDEADTTVVYLVSDAPFEASL
jgi:integrating conjugative element protein (TIGR03749 family)